MKKRIVIWLCENSAVIIKAQPHANLSLKVESKVIIYLPFKSYKWQIIITIAKWKSSVTNAWKAAKLNLQFWQKLKENGRIRAFATNCQMSRFLRVTQYFLYAIKGRWKFNVFFFENGKGVV